MTYAGGARDLDDLARVRELGKGRVDLTIGSALDIFGGNLALDAVLQWQREHTRRETRQRARSEKMTRLAPIFPRYSISNKSENFCLLSLQDVILRDDVSKNC